MKSTEHIGREMAMALMLPKSQSFLKERMGVNVQKEGRSGRCMVFEPTERLHLGAEAEVWKGTWFGRPAVRKQRRPRSWRHPNLDHRLGVRRMISEARLLIRTRKAGLSVPSVWDLDYEGGQLIIEHLNGRPPHRRAQRQSNHGPAGEGRPSKGRCCRQGIASHGDHAR